jgi:ribonuclease T1
MAIVLAGLLMCGALVGCGEEFLGRDAPYPALDPAEVQPDVDPQTGLAWLSLDELPATAQATLTLVEAGGVPPDSDGGSEFPDAFPDAAGLLPERPSGFYRTYPVPMPEADGPTPWHLVVADDGAVFWTANDFGTLRRVRE